MKYEGGIYIILSKIDGKKYIGQTIGFKKRFKYHRITLRGNKHRNPHLQHAWNKYGEENFEFIEFFPCEREKFGYWELFFVRKFNTLDQTEGYNIHIPDGTGRGFSLSDETKARISAAQLGKKGKSPSPETRRKISEALKGRKLSPETLAKISGKNNHCYGRTGAKHPMFGRTWKNHPRFGKAHTKETKKKMSIASRKRWGNMSKEDYENVAIANGGKPFIVYKDGIKMGRHISQTLCAKELGVKQPQISDCLHNHTKSVNGYTFVFCKPLEEKELS